MTDLDLALRTLRLILRGARSQPEPQLRQTVEDAADAIEAILDDTDREAAAHPHFRLIRGGLAPAAAAVVTASAAKRLARQPGVVITTAGAVAAAGAAAVALYVTVPDGVPDATPPQPAGRPPRRPTPVATRSAVPAPRRTSAPLTPVANVAAPLIAGTPVLLPGGATSLPPVSPSPPDQHATCMRLRVGADAKVALCRTRKGTSLP